MDSLSRSSTSFTRTDVSLQPGERVQILEGDRALAKLIGELQTPRKPRQPGSAIGILTIVSEHKTHSPEFQDRIP